MLPAPLRQRTTAELASPSLTASLTCVCVYTHARAHTYTHARTHARRQAGTHPSLWPADSIGSPGGSRGRGAVSPIPRQPAELQTSAPHCTGVRPPQILLEMLLAGPLCLSFQAAPRARLLPPGAGAPCGSHRRMATQMGSAGGQRSLACGSAKSFS